MNSKFVSAVCFLIVLVSACSKDDNPPVIEMFGENPDTIYVKAQSTYADPGAEAVDSEEGEVGLIISSNLNATTINQPGNYVVYYNAKDKYDNVAIEKTREVKVIRAQGMYQFNETCPSSPTTHVIDVNMSSNATNDTISLNGFPFPGDVAKMVVKEGGFTIYSQTFGSITTVSGTLDVVNKTGSQMDATYVKTIGAPPVSETCTATVRKN